MVYREDGFEEDGLVSGGNFHGEYPAKAADLLAMSMHRLGVYCERRIARMVNCYKSKSLPFLVENGGINSGYMIMQCTSAALCSENKVLAVPASVDSLETSAGQEDHVSMGGFAARKLLLLL